MGAADLASIASHESVDVVALCDYRFQIIWLLLKSFNPNAKTYSDYRTMLRGNDNRY